MNLVFFVKYFGIQFLKVKHTLLNKDLVLEWGFVAYLRGNLQLSCSRSLQKMLNIQVSRKLKLSFARGQNVFSCGNL